MKTRFEIFSSERPWGPWKRAMSYGIWGRGLEHADGQQVHIEQRPEDVVLVLWRVPGRRVVLRLPVHAAVPVDRRGRHLRGRGRQADRRHTASGYPGCSGTGYIENFTNPGNRAVFALDNVNGAGWHIVRIRYTSPKVNGNVLSIYVNGRKAKRVKFSENGSDCSPELDWTDRSDIYYLNSGANTFEIRHDLGDSGAGLMIDYLAVSREPTCDEGVNVAAGDRHRLVGRSRRGHQRMRETRRASGRRRL